MMKKVPIIAIEELSIVTIRTCDLEMITILRELTDTKHQ